MTCIVAVRNKDRGTVILGADSRRSLNGGFITTTLPDDRGKIFRFNDHFLIGHTGAGKIRHYTSKIHIPFGKLGPRRALNLEDTVLEYVIPSLKRTARSYEMLETDKGVPNLDGQILIAFADEVCLIGGDFCVTPITGDYFSVGSGMYFALGAFHAMNALNVKPSTQAKYALTAASALTESVGPPFSFMETTPRKKLKK